MTEFKHIKIFLSVINLLLMASLLIFDMLGELKQHEITLIFIILSVSFSIVHLLCEWLEFKFRDDNEKYYAKLEADRFKRYLRHVKREILSKDPFK